MTSATTNRRFAGSVAPARGDPAQRRGRAATRGERGEVVVAEEGRLPPAGVPRSEDVDAEELQERDGDRDGSPEHEPAEHDREVRGASHEQRNGQSRASAYSTSFRKLTRWSSKSESSRETGRKRLEREPGEEGGSGQPERAARRGAAPSPSLVATRPPRRSRRPARRHPTGGRRRSSHPVRLRDRAGSARARRGTGSLP